MLIWILAQLVNAYTLIIFVYILMSWIPQKRGVLADIEHALGLLCEPYLKLFRKIIPPVGGTIDFSPIVAILVLQIAMRIIYWLF